MQSAVERILEGQFNTENKTLVFSVPVIEIKVGEGTSYEGNFTIYGPEDEITEGRVSSTDIRMKCPVPEFSGQEVEIPFIFETTGLSDGDNTKGEFRIISNQGEYILPYDICVERNNPDTSLGNIKNLFHFTNLARTNWQEAAELFSTEEFEKVLNGSDRQYVSVYHSLYLSRNKEQSLEEFLLHVKKKQLAEFFISDPNVRVENVLTDVDKMILISRNGWGYSDFNIETESDFITLSQKEIKQEDFIGNTARIPYTILADKIHEGRNFGTIRIVNAYNDIKISLTVIKNVINRKVADISRSYKHNMIELMQYYEAFRLKKISTNSWMESTLDVLEKLKDIDPDNLKTLLMYVQLLITQERYNEARWMLEQNSARAIDSEDPAIYCYYYYLTTLIDRSEEHINEVTKMMEKLHERFPANWRIGWLLLYLSDECTRFPDVRWSFIEKMYKEGAKSPALYIEAIQILNNNPTFLDELKPFEMSVLRFMAKTEVLTPPIIEQFLNLLARYNLYDKNLYRLLVACYKVVPSEEVLTKIVSILIKQGRTDREAFEWYARAVDKRLRITRLYESYMTSIDLDSNIEIPKMVLMYFAFDTSLDVIHTSYLYCYVYRNKGIYPELFENYHEAIERFTMSQLLKGHNNRFLSYLYRNMVSENLVSEDIAKGLVRALFVHRIIPFRKNIASIAVFYENITIPVEFVVRKEEEIYIPLYGNNYQIVIIDKDKNRFLGEDDFKVERLMVPDKLASYIGDSCKDELFYNLWVCENSKDINLITSDNVEAMKYLSESDIVVRKVRNTIKSNLLHFYYDSDRLDELDSLLEGITPDDIIPQAASDVIRFMLARGRYESAYEWICLFGSDNIEPKILIRLCNKMLRTEQTINGDLSENEILLNLLHRAFVRGKYDDASLVYLCRFFKGTTKEMRDIFKAAKENGTDTSEIEERILVQQLYTNSFSPGTVPVYISYVEKNLGSDISKAYLSQVCFDYFVNERIIEDDYFDVIERMIDKGIDLMLPCKLAYTRKCAGLVRDLDENTLRVLMAFLKEILNEGMYFPYFREYAKNITFMHRFLDKTMVEYRVKEGNSATIHYMIEKNADSDDEYIQEEMREMYHGICVKSFVLFFGERLSYYIIEHGENGDVLTESNTYSHNDLDTHEGFGRFDMINDISISRTLNDKTTMDSLLNEYFKNEYLLQNLFSPLTDGIDN